LSIVSLRAPDAETTATKRPRGKIRLKHRKSTLLLGTLAASAIVFAPADFASAESGADVLLFKVVTVKDDVVVGWTADELNAIGGGEPLGVVSSQLQQAGQLSVWQYATKKDQDGALKMMPLRRIVVFSSGTARIEPYNSPLPVLPPS
jgi:hypothetical protein